MITMMRMMVAFMQTWSGRRTWRPSPEVSSRAENCNLKKKRTLDTTFQEKITNENECNISQFVKPPKQQQKDKITFQPLIDKIKIKSLLQNKKIKDHLSATDKDKDKMIITKQKDKKS